MHLLTQLLIVVLLAFEAQYLCHLLILAKYIRISVQCKQKIQLTTIKNLHTVGHAYPQESLFPWIFLKLATCLLRIRAIFGFYNPKTVFEPEQTQNKGFIGKSLYVFWLCLGNNPISFITLTLTLTFRTIMLLLNVKIFRL